MSGVLDLDTLLRSMKPELDDTEFVFCTVNGKVEEYVHLQPLACFAEKEGLTLILPVQTARQAGLEHAVKFKKITLTVHSSLEAVGLTAAVATKLAAAGISANVIAAYFHDHIFVQSEKTQEALSALAEFND